MDTKMGTIHFDEDGYARFVTWMINETSRYPEVRVKVFQPRHGTVPTNLFREYEDAVEWGRENG